MLRGNLFTQNFLLEGITDYNAWNAVSDIEMEAFREQITKTLQAFPMDEEPNEDTTKTDLIEPVLKALGWEQFLPEQQANKFDIPDYLLFDSQENKQQANREKKSANRYKHGLVSLEAKAWNVLLDRKGDKTFERTPANQIIRYITNVDVQSDGQMKWGILTNGRLWRIYYSRAKSKAEDFLEIDLPYVAGLKAPYSENATLPSEDQDWLKVFYLLFQKASFLPNWEEGKTFHEFIIEEGKYWESKVTTKLSDAVFYRAYPRLLNALYSNDPQAPQSPDADYFETLKTDALTFLYRLLFILYAEDRNLLPVYNATYLKYGLRKKVREDIANRIDHAEQLSKTQEQYHYHVHGLFKAIDKGDESIGVPPYNGGLFKTDETPILNRAMIPDKEFAEIFDRLSRDEEKRWINYRDLSVQQLGSIYESLLEFHPYLDDQGAIQVSLNLFARKSSGSYYTPDSLVHVIIDETVGPLLEEKRQQFYKQIEKFKSDKTSNKKQKNRALRNDDPAQAMLELKICDPAMGSGHFLVSLVDYMADYILKALDEVKTAVSWADNDHPYQSPLTDRITQIRETILQEAENHNWVINKEQLDDRHLVRRMILKRCIYGVDKNPMAVELAKVSLWLHTFTVGAPLSFLDHHLKSGDSLFGEWINTVHQDMDVLTSETIQKAKEAAQGMLAIENLTDADITEVETSSSTFQRVEKATQPLNEFVKLYHAFRWVTDKNKERQKLFKQYLMGTFGNIFAIAQDSSEVRQNAKNRQEFLEMLEEGKKMVREQGFFNWEIEFPTIWQNWKSESSRGGFDAVIGNPPWDRMKMQEVEWFAARKPEIAKAARAQDRKQMIQKLKADNTPLWQQYERASWLAKAAIDRARKDGQYPLLSGGDINLYSLFVERAHKLVSAKGLVGLVVPSGIAADKNAARFFQQIATEGRLRSLYDFENKKVFFPDIDSRFKFCTYVAGGNKRYFDNANLGFFLHATSEIEEKAFHLTPEDFQRVNPNTGTAPLFRTPRDAEITRKIYQEFPVLHDYQKGKVWPVKYLRMFDMTNDSHLFKTKEELEQEGFYPVGGNQMKKGEEVYVPLYVGRMIHHYNHRAASVDTNAENIHNAALSTEISVEHLQNTNFHPNPQYWVPLTEVKKRVDLEYFLVFRDIARSTDARTFIATIIPPYGCSNKLPVLVPEEGNLEYYKTFSPLLLANFCSIPFDYVLAISDKLCQLFRRYYATS